MPINLEGMVNAGRLEDILLRGCTVVTGGGRTIAVFAHGNNVYALDNRCPHMGFPLSQGTVQDGILTCHWHHARFDLVSGDTFDLFAGDIPRFRVQLVNGQVWIDLSSTDENAVDYWKRRLTDGLEHNIPLVIARSVIGMTRAGADYRLPLEMGALFGVRFNAEGWSPALSILTSCANMLPFMRKEDRPLALYHGLVQIAQECEGKPARFPVAPLSETGQSIERLKVWFRQFVEVRDAEAAERTLRTAIECGMAPVKVAELVFSAITDHLFVDGGHTIDFANKAFELLGHIGWKHAGSILTSLVPQLVIARRSEEISSWRHPIDLTTILFQAYDELPSLWDRGQTVIVPWNREEQLVEELLKDDPSIVIQALKEAVAAGASPESLGSVVTEAAFIRLARYHLSNEFTDWDTVHHCVTTANAVHAALCRTQTFEILRGVFDTAMSVYQARFLNIPSAALPRPDRGTIEDADPTEMLEEFLEELNRQQQVAGAANRVANYLATTAPVEPLLATLAHATLREDAGFHQFQMTEAALRQYQCRMNQERPEQGKIVLIGASRFLAAHSPTVRSAGQTYNTALRLDRGDQIFQDELDTD